MVFKSTRDRIKHKKVNENRILAKQKSSNNTQQQQTKKTKLDKEVNRNSKSNRYINYF